MATGAPRKLSIRAVSSYSAQGSRRSDEDHSVAVREKGIFVVADGFGGAGPGKGAAQAACDSIRAFLEKEAGDLDATLPFVLRSYFSLAGNVLFNALLYANRKVLAANRGKSVHERGGASAIAAFLDGDLLAIASVGCCSAWLARPAEGAGEMITELVVPRTYARLREPFGGGKTELQAPLAALGISEDLEPEIAEYRIRPGDWLILHTDGLGSPERLLSELRKSGLDPSASAEEAARRAAPAPGGDNASFLMVIF